MTDEATMPTVSPPSSIVGNTTGPFWLYDPVKGYDLSHPPTPDAPSACNRITLNTTTASVTISPDKTALIVIDMQNFFLGMNSERGEGHNAEDVLLKLAIPAAEKSGIQIVHITWGISDQELLVLPPTIFRIFGWDESRPVQDNDSDPEKEVKCALGVGDDIGNMELPNGSTIPVGRMLMRDQWNTDLHEPLKNSFEMSQKTSKPQLRFHKARLSGFWASSHVGGALKSRGFTTLLFAGVNTDQCVLASIQDACNIGFDTILLLDGCGTDSPSYTKDMVMYNCRKSWGFVSSCTALADGVDHMNE
jgi:nicotinamidase-related amidase